MKNETPQLLLSDGELLQELRARVRLCLAVQSQKTALAQVGQSLDQLDKQYQENTDR